MNDTFVEVVTQEDGPLRWTVASRTETLGQMTTLVHRQLGARNATSGFGGPILRPGGLPAYWSGTSTGFPEFVLVRTGPDILTATVIGSDGINYPIPLSDRTTEFNLRFGAIPLPDGVSADTLHFTSESGNAWGDRVAAPRAQLGLPHVDGGER